MVYVQLGRYGDIINTLPLLHLLAQEQQRPVQLMVARKYADVLDGVSHVQPVVYEGAFEDLAGALKLLAGQPHTNLQVYGRGMSMRRQTTSFIREQWHRAGRAAQWGAPLVFDRRNAAREQELVQRHCDGRPLVLLGLSGHSSPFAHAERMKQRVAELCSPHAQVLDLATVQAHRIYDLLGLYDKAACLVAIDTSHQHLAHGSTVPVLALSTDGPTRWHSSPRRTGHVFYARYDQYEAREHELLDAMRALLNEAGCALPTPPRMLHVYPWYTMQGDALRRHTTAAATWQNAGGWTDLPFARAPRDARALGDPRDLPYMRDMVEHALAQATKDDDVVVLSNSDVCVVPHMTRLMHDAVQRHGAFYTHRWDFAKPVGRHTDPAHGKWYPGSDLFGFSVRWWREHGHRYPDMLAGAEYVDCVLRQLIKQVCGTGAEVHRAVYHEKHASAWERDRHCASNRYNRLLAEAWFAQHGTDDLDPFGPVEAERIRARRRHATMP